MRRANCILALLALLAAPLALLARNQACEQDDCTMTCCRPHSQTHQTRVPDATQTKGHCQHQASDDECCCQMRSAGNHGPNLGIAAPLPPTLPESVHSIPAPPYSRNLGIVRYICAPDGIALDLLKPPRA
ncbi:MAG: hypothetical protein ACRD50_06740 [Candidatus Acidiferrales bacterium]